MGAMEAKISVPMAGLRKWAEFQPMRVTEVSLSFAGKAPATHSFQFMQFFSGYKGQDGYCHANDPNVTLVAPITGWVNVTSGNQNAMKLALLQHGPISVAIDASHKTFSFYSNGVYYEPKWLVYPHPIF